MGDLGIIFWWWFVPSAYDQGQSLCSAEMDWVPIVPISYLYAPLFYVLIFKYLVGLLIEYVESFCNPTVIDGFGFQNIFFFLQLVLFLIGYLFVHVMCRQCVLLCSDETHRCRKMEKGENKEKKEKGEEACNTQQERHNNFSIACNS